MKDFFWKVFFYIFVGACCAVGIRAIEYAIPAPATRVYVCLFGENEKVEICKTLEELKAIKST